MHGRNGKRHGFCIVDRRTTNYSSDIWKTLIELSSVKYVFYKKLEDVDPPGEVFLLTL